MNAPVKNAAFLFSFLLSSGAAVGGNVVYVDADATGPSHDGASWCAAFLSLSEAFGVAGFGDTIHVAGGQYTPDPTGLADARDAAFAIPDGVTVEGGYAGCGASDPNERGLDSSILSGDLIGDDLPDFGNRGDNVYHVVTTHDVDDTTVLDGLTITGGHADGPNFGPSVDSRNQGGGVNNYFGHTLLVNCTIVDNYADNHGAFNDHGGATIEGCSFRDNWSGNVAGGLYMHFDMDTVVTNTEFINNETAGRGGGAYNKGNTTSSFTNCLFQGNRAARGGGMYNDNGSNPTLVGCMFDTNWANAQWPEDRRGGGMYNNAGSSPQLNDCTFDSNHAFDGDGIYNDGSLLTLADCTLISNSGAFGGQLNQDGDLIFPGGGGFYATNGSVVTVTNCVFDSNSGNRYGGAMFADLGSELIVDSCMLTGNFAYWGPLWVKSSTIDIRDTLFIDNHGNYAGGMRLFASSGVNTGCSFIDNSAGQWNGGAIQILTSDAIITNCLFAGNVANVDGARSPMRLKTPERLAGSASV